MTVESVRAAYCLMADGRGSALTYNAVRMLAPGSAPGNVTATHCEAEAERRDARKRLGSIIMIISEA